MLKERIRHLVLELETEPAELLLALHGAVHVAAILVLGDDYFQRIAALLPIDKTGRSYLLMMGGAQLARIAGLIWDLKKPRLWATYFLVFLWLETTIIQLMVAPRRAGIYASAVFAAANIWIAWRLSVVRELERKEADNAA